MRHKIIQKPKKIRRPKMSVRSLNYRDGVIGEFEKRTNRNGKSDSQLRLRSLLQVDENRTPKSC